MHTEGASFITTVPKVMESGGRLMDCPPFPTIGGARLVKSCSILPVEISPGMSFPLMRVSIPNTFPSFAYIRTITLNVHEYYISTVKVQIENESDWLRDTLRLCVPNLDGESYPKKDTSSKLSFTS